MGSDAATRDFGPRISEPAEANYGSNARNGASLGVSQISATSLLTVQQCFIGEGIETPFSHV